MIRRHRAHEVPFVLQAQPLDPNDEASSGAGEAGTTLIGGEAAGDRQAQAWESRGSGTKQGCRGAGGVPDLQSFPLHLKPTPFICPQEGLAQRLQVWSDHGSSSAHLEGAEPVLRSHCHADLPTSGKRCEVLTLLSSQWILYHLPWGLLALHYQKKKQISPKI